MKLAYRRWKKRGRTRIRIEIGRLAITLDFPTTQGVEP